MSTKRQRPWNGDPQTAPDAPDAPDDAPAMTRAAWRAMGSLPSNWARLGIGDLTNGLQAGCLNDTERDLVRSNLLARPEAAVVNRDGVLTATVNGLTIRRVGRCDPAGVSHIVADIESKYTLCGMKAATRPNGHGITSAGNVQRAVDGHDPVWCERCLYEWSKP